MNVSNTTTVHSTILPLATLASGVVRTARRGAAIRLYRAEPVFVGAAHNDAVGTLLGAGALVRVYEKNRIWTPVLVDGAVVWNSRDTGKCRASVVVEVSL
jgi:hypothetical protein